MASFLHGESQRPLHGDDHDIGNKDAVAGRALWALEHVGHHRITPEEARTILSWAAHVASQGDFQAEEEGRLNCLAEMVKEDLTLDPSSCRDDVMGFLWMRVYFIEISLRKKHGIILICLVLSVSSASRSERREGGNRRGSAGAWLRRTGEGDHLFHPILSRSMIPLIPFRSPEPQSVAFPGVPSFSYQQGQDGLVSSSSKLAYKDATKYGFKVSVSGTGSRTLKKREPKRRLEIHTPLNSWKRCQIGRGSKTETNKIIRKTTQTSVTSLLFPCLPASLNQPRPSIHPKNQSDPRQRGKEKPTDGALFRLLSSPVIFAYRSPPYPSIPARFTCLVLLFCKKVEKRSERDLEGTAAFAGPVRNL
ncbi:uncharacterized protein CLUP02_08798 [Colletotrichum lupini]|uniref:Uncharacterized protein n=1 Tax=Colletotrichum lupini TaxID=145971 RepID=A0A9Q8WGY9_9PEZI|nr:uncharacterized protein CLUP02_08798 [Colletotrichum lupini]UQC83303.1 hypothetical protein CLUP02_08798 [Colletotrichum lupini]